MNSVKRSAERRTQEDRRRESSELILDKAEALFAHSGFDGVTLNDVADASGMATSLVRYYFEDKASLFKAVVSRRSQLANDIRVKALKDYEAEAGENLTLEGVIRGFTAPIFETMAADRGFRNYAAIISFVASSRAEFHELMSENYDSISQIVIGHMKRLLPEATEEDVYWGYLFLTGALTYSIGQTGRIDRLSGGLCRSDDFKSISDRLPTTLAAGIRAMCAERIAARKVSTAAKGGAKTKSKSRQASGNISRGAGRSVRQKS